jgi:hypothetical protein
MPLLKRYKLVKRAVTKVVKDAPQKAAEALVGRGADAGQKKILGQ